ncbi:DUF488 family protein [Gramella jeungdoensis]|uniref:DUF488 family protein n=1 Tax=Gramella jeungdoensis TaxID=708091 RepID=A0ABT0Z546_9FLAO|nr:DUF488 family protein [Gramella jeungdoensis]MCM8570836.1 DUF488 family protein [Gramella jeungdoensis]
MKTIRTKRIYEKPYDQDGYRILVDRIWPRGVSKQAARLDEWKKEIAPSDKLRKWFDHDPEKFDEFSKKYREELKEKKELLENVRKVAKENRITLVYAAKDEKNNQAVVLKNILEGN